MIGYAIFCVYILKDDRGSFNSHAKSTYYAHTGYVVLHFSDKIVHNNVTVAKRIKDSVYQYLC